MEDNRKTKAQLIHEVGELRRQLAESQAQQPLSDADTNRWLLPNGATSAFPLSESSSAAKERNPGEISLARALNFTQALLDSIPTPVFMKDRQGKYLGCNRAYTEFMGVSAEKIRGKTVQELWPGEQAQVYHQKDLELMEKPQQQVYEFTVTDRDGAIRPVVFAKNVFRDENGEVAGIVGAFVDITERKQMERAIALTSETQQQIARLDTLHAVYQLVGESIQQLIGDGYTAVTLFDESQQAMRLAGLFGMGKVYQALVKRFKIDITQMSFSLSEIPQEDLRFFRSGQLEEYPDGLYKLLVRKVPKSICQTAQKQLKIRGMYTMGFTWQGTHYGGVTILAKREITPYRRVIETIVHQASIAMMRILSENALRAAEQKVQNIIRHSNSMFYTHTVDNVLTYASPQAKTILGCEPEEALVSWLQFITDHPINQQGIEATERAICTGERQPPYELELLRRDGRRIWVLVDESPMVENGKTVAIIGSVTDITARKEAEDAIRRSENRFKALIENAPDGAVLISSSGQFKYFSPSAGKTFGYTSEDLDDLDPNELTHPDDLPQVHAALAAIVQDPALVQTLEYRFRNKDGSWRWIESTFSNQLAEPALQGIVINFRDINERKMRQRELEAETMIAQALSATNELDALLAEVLKAARHAIPTAEKGGLALLTPDGRLQVRALSGYQDASVLGFSYPISWGFAGRVVSGRQPCLIGDVQQDTELRQAASQVRISEVRDLRSAVAVPLLVHEKIIGVLSLESSQPGVFCASDLHLLSNLAVSAALIIERARLFAETNRRVAELEMLYESGLLLGRLLDPAEIGSQVISLLERKLDWHHTTIRLHNPQTGELRLLAYNQPGLTSAAERQAVAERFQKQIPTAGHGLTGWAVQHAQTVRIGDVSSDPRYVDTYPGLHSGLYVPMQSGERIVGVIAIESEATDAFSSEDERLVETLANQAASALENARLLGETRQRLSELETLQSVSAALRQAHSAEDMLPIFISQAAKAVDAQFGSIYLLEENSAGWVSKGLVNAHGEWLPGADEMRHRLGEGITGHVGASGEVHFSPDWHMDKMGVFTQDELAFVANLCSSVSLPLRAESMIIGVIHIWWETAHAFTEYEKRLLTAIADMAGNALQRARLHERIERQVQRLDSLHAIDMAISSSVDLRLTLSVLIDQVITQLGVDAADVLLLRPGLKVLEYAAGRGFRSKNITQSRIRLGECYAGQSILERRLMTVPRLSEARPAFTRWPLLQSESIVAYYVIPLVARGQVKGVLEIYHRSELNPGAEWLGFLETLGGQAAIAIDNAELHEDLQRSNTELRLAYDVTIEGWSRALDLRDKETEGHTQRVTEMTLRLARLMGIAEEDLTQVRHGALLHDIGKMGIPDGILLKPGALTADEWEVMRKHPIYAYDLLQPIAFLRPALDIPYCHHEKWDGTGYPRGLKGDQIPLAARIFAVVDVWDALRSDRPYRPGWVEERVLEHIRTQSGIHFDPRVVELFLQLMSRK